MLIRKLFKFENAHIVRDCTTRRCSENIHGHSYKIEVLLESNYLDNGQMVYDFGLTKRSIKEMIDSFDHAITLWSKDDTAYVTAMKTYSNRWIELPVSPSAEQFSRVIYLIVERILACTGMQNGEKNVSLHSIIVHETETGYAQGFKEDAHSELMGSIRLEEIVFSPQVQSEWTDPELWKKLLAQECIQNPAKV
ncbi:MAG TPA: 6-carboxytetrahydropterin synthase [Sulfurovum sp.]|nr:MAG: 6-carboxytetrahydropterin synthase QueD [Sulfurovum sp. 35-42-20]OYY57636.1 MAG: 6-carboxytetrahydropterin synthase QueD [Sulfurovum sp. 28-43-6]OYZ26288.1 MAG: 6-carboxytetrahydropterin synthase QueD [Sulfurovum sp. 16-42-52]OYZ49965.1 MAG: 6-carboxytetrahydropterin synthase QueD [Sulfurovum sp. 24-42-9]OZA46534.1 MAG: 6-carboxytetrahydropterin synthase QueD [Sulfurovum sp. 17-42-90]OZA59959.1 MAG: 6-carboxytetrahydropterin synthase QueD [Sulfurovum sp. 39-42-12]HQR73554.1 6-carboxyt